MNPRRLGSRYLLHGQLGQGAMGVVWRGQDLDTGTEVAVKLLRSEYTSNPAFVARFVGERNALVRFRHPNVVALRDMIVEGDRLALVMELVTGGDLNAFRERNGGTVSPSVAVRLGAQVSDGLAAAHAAGIVHRDLKPANMLLEGGQVKLADFGIARIAGGTKVTSAGIVMGTVAYLAPELIMGSDPGAPGDIYAVGITLYELLTGAVPFDGHVAAVMHAHMHAVPDRIPGIPDQLWSLIAACLSKDPAARPTAAALAAGLRALSASAAPAAQDIGAAGAQQADATANTQLPSAVVTSTDLPPVNEPAAPPPSRMRTLQVPKPRRRLSGLLVALAVLAAAISGGVTYALVAGTPGAPGAQPGNTSAGQGQPTTLGGGDPGPSATPGARQAATTSPGDPTGSGSPTSPDTKKPGQSKPTPKKPQPTKVAPKTTAPTTVAPTTTPPTTPATTPPPNVPWTCGSTVPAKLASGSPTGGSLTACVRVYNGTLQMKGTLTGPVTSPTIQIRLELKDQQGALIAADTSGACGSNPCTYTIGLSSLTQDMLGVVPAWMVNGAVQSVGAETPLVQY